MKILSLNSNNSPGRSGQKEQSILSPNLFPGRQAFQETSGRKTLAAWGTGASLAGPELWVWAGSECPAHNQQMGP